MKARVAFLALLFSGCAVWSSITEPALGELGRADALVARGDYTAALAAYDDILNRRPKGAHVDRARRARDTVVEILATRDERARLDAALGEREAELERVRAAMAARDAEVARLTRELSARDADVARTRQELAAARQELAAARQELQSRQGEIVRISAEADRLRNAIEDLKRLEIRMERPR